MALVWHLGPCISQSIRPSGPPPPPPGLGCLLIIRFGILWNFSQLWGNVRMAWVSGSFCRLLHTTWGGGFRHKAGLGWCGPFSRCPQHRLNPPAYCLGTMGYPRRQVG